MTVAGATVVSTMRDEGAFLLDWVAHHKALGFESLLICTNDCLDPTPRMVLRLQAMGLARHHATRHWPATSMQRSAYKQATRYPEVREAAWLYACDADEYLTVRLGDGTLSALLAAAGPAADAIAVPWRIFGPDGRVAYEDRPVTALFRRAQAAPRFPEQAQIYAKSVVRGLSRLHRIGVHLPVPKPGLDPPFLVELPGGRPLGRQASPMHVAADYACAQVNHYALRSLDSFLVKRARGRVNHMNDEMGLDYWDRFDIAEVPCDGADRLAGATAAWRARLLADAPLAALHAEAVAWHRARAAALRAEPGNAALLAALARRTACASPAS